MVAQISSSYKNIFIHIVRNTLLLLSSFFQSDLAAADNRINIGNFSAGKLDNWESQSFEGFTEYRLVKLAGIQVLKAESTNAASGLFKKQRIDLQKTPYLNWRWRIKNKLNALNEQSKTGDDYAARLYVVIDGGWTFWQTRAINYVWSSNSPVGMVWPNAFAGDHAIMIALRSTTDQTGTWYSEKRNVLNDLNQYVGSSVRYIDAIALMTDTDNANGHVTAYYGDIYFTQE